MNFGQNPPLAPLIGVGVLIVCCMMGETFGWIKLHFAERKKRRHERRIINFYIVERPLEVPQ